MKKKVTFDLEVYRDYFLAAFRSYETKSVVLLEMFSGHTFDVETARNIFKKYTLVGFNSNSFDMPLLSYAMHGATTEEIKVAADDIILHNLKPWKFSGKYSAIFEPDHIDLIEVAPGVASLKTYSGRLHCRKMQDLPIDPDELIFDGKTIVVEGVEMTKLEAIRAYCENDLANTEALYVELEKQIDLRVTMSAEIGEDVRSKSDAQIAEAVIRSQIGLKRIPRTNIEVGKIIKFAKPRYIQFQGEMLREVSRTIEATEFVVMDAGKIVLPKHIANLDISIGSSVYRMGIGGLHSSESSVAHVCGEGEVLIDRDVASYYPSIILETGLYPETLGPKFLEVYRRIVERRLEAKHSGDKVVADSLKITINGAFGKFGSPYSILYAPQLLIQTTLTGQLSLLMLIEALEVEGVPVVSANTDGIVIKVREDQLDLVDNIIAGWEVVTGFDTEATEYRAVYSRDVNNYIALKKGGGVKLKGAFAPPTIAKHPTNQICIEAVVLYLRDGIPLETTILGCDDIRKFVTIKSVTGGAVKGDAYLGRAVRWYYAKGETGTINYKVNGNTVARSEGARPLMTLPDTMPDDLDLEWYLREARSLLVDLGVEVAE